MNSRKIDDQIREYYAAQKPSTETITRVKQTVRAGVPPRRPRRVWMAAAVALVIAVLSFVWTVAGHRPPPPEQIAVAVAREAAIGHNEKQELEFQARECAELRAKMKSLDFTPVEPVMMREMNMHIVGARYTTIAGAIAAQIVYRDAKGVPCTLYEVRPVERLARVATGEHQIDGVHVALWKEKSLIMVLVRPMA